MDLPVGNFIGKPLLCAGLMGVGAWAGYGLLVRLTGAEGLSLLVTILAAVVVYGALVLALGIFGPKDWAQMPLPASLRRRLCPEESTE